MPAIEPVDGCDCAQCASIRRGLSEPPKLDVTAAFTEVIEETIEVEEGLVQCGGCEAWVEEDELYSVSWQVYRATSGIVEEAGLWCDDCTRCCYRCDEVFRNDAVREVWDDYYCAGCLTACPHCENSMPVGNSYCSDSCRDEAQGCSCDSPATEFSIRNDGEDPLDNDVRVTVSLPAGVISTEGISAIREYLRSIANAIYEDGEFLTRAGLRDLANRVHYLDARWQTKDGNFTKRLSKLAYKDLGLKVSPEIVSQVGCIAREHSTASDFDIEITRDINGTAEEFGNEGSCWWGSEAESRCALKFNGGFGLRAFGQSETWSNGHVHTPTLGRAWVIPLRKANGGHLVATFETMTPDAFVVFNGYGNLGGYAPARVMSHMAGMTYRKIDFSTEGSMYVNGSSAYLVAPEEIANPYTDGQLSIKAPVHSDLFNIEQERADNEIKEDEYV